MSATRTLQLLGLQYELALLIGKGLVLETMLREFFPPALKRLGCRAAYVWLPDDDLLTLRYVYPRSERARVEAGGDLAGLAFPGQGAAEKRTLAGGREVYLHGYALGKLGHCLLVRDRGPLDEATRIALLPLMARLGDACAACLEHEHAQRARAATAERERELRLKTAEQEVILQSTQIGITFTANRVHHWVNDTFARMVGYSADELIGQSSRQHFPDEAAFIQLGIDAYPVIERGEAFADERLFRRRNGEVFPVLMFGKIVDLADPTKGAIWTVIDITERKRAEEDTRRALEQQRELNDLKSRFVSMTSHEFRTPLATILSSSELLRHYADRLGADERTEVLGSIGVAVRRMTQMLDNILVIGRTDAGRLEFVPGPVEIARLCRDIAEEAACAHAPDGKGLARLDLTIELSTDRAELDEKLLRHILGNLLSNAYKYSPPEKRIEFTVGLADGQLRLRIADHGIGIPVADLPRLFEPFHRAGNVGNIAGTGLGMAIVQRASVLHGGHVDVASEPGRGTAFTITLPWRPL